MRIYPARQACILNSRRIPLRSLLTASAVDPRDEAGNTPALGKKAEHQAGSTDGSAATLRSTGHHERLAVTLQPPAPAAPRALPSTAVVCRSTADIPAARALRLHPRGEGGTAPWLAWRSLAYGGSARLLPGKARALYHC